MDSGYSAQLDHLILLYIQYRLLFKISYISFELFFKQKIGNRNFFCPNENRK